MTTLALDYPLGRPVVPAALVRRERPLPPFAIPYVSVGDRVNPEKPIAQRGEGDVVHPPVLAGMVGRVTEVVPEQHITIEGPATVVHGLVGLGGPVVGTLAQLPRGESLAVVPIPAEAIIVYPQQAPLMLLQRAAAGGARGIIAASMAARELEAFARTDLSMVLDGLAPEPAHLPLTILLTEGFGAVPMNPAIYAMLMQRLGATALLTGTTNPARNIRPEVLTVVLEGTPLAQLPADSTLAAGALVRVVAGPLRGARGEILHVFGRDQATSGHVRADAAVLRVESGAVEMAPLHALVREG